MEKTILPLMIKKIPVFVFGIVFLASFVWAQASPATQKKAAPAALPVKSEAPSIPLRTENAKRNVQIIKEADIQYEIPAGWRTEAHTDAMQITAPDGSVSIIIGLAVNDNTEAMIVGLKDYLKQDYKNFKVGSDLQKESINGLRVLIENGSGETSEGVMEWNIVVLFGGKRPIIAFTVAEQKAFKQSQADYVRLVQSIKKVDNKR
jgi:predicted Zn-dependent protease